MSEVVCDREFGLTIDGVERRVVVEWMKPHRYKGDWRCDWVIHWPHHPEQTRYAVGVDSVQALLLAMKSVSSELYNVEPDVFWHAPGDKLDLPVLEDDGEMEASRK